MKHLKIVFPLVAVFFGLLLSCQKNHKQGEFLLSDEMKAQNPYQLGAKLIFLSDSSITYPVTIGSRYDTIYRTLAGMNTNEYYFIEVERTWTLYTSTTDIPGLSLEMAGKVNQPANFRIDVNFNNKGRSWSFELPLNKEYTPFLDSIQVQGNWFYDVYYNELEKKENRAYKLYYSTQYGIVKIDFSDGSFWELESVEWAERE
jgi:hypothetical protein